MAELIWIELSIESIRWSFGIEDKENDVNSDLIPYQKYYQRVVKETGTKFEEFFKPVYEYSNVGIAK